MYVLIYKKILYLLLKTVMDIKKVPCGLRYFCQIKLKNVYVLVHFLKGFVVMSHRCARGSLVRWR